MIKEAILLMDNLIGFDSDNDARVLTMQNEGDIPLGKVKMMFRNPRNMIILMMKVYARFELR